MKRKNRTRRRKDRLFFTDWYEDVQPQYRPWSKTLLVPMAIVGVIFTVLLVYAVILAASHAPEIGLRFAIIAVILLLMGVAFGLMVGAFRSEEKMLMAGQARESAERKYLMTLINSLTDAVLALDKNGRIIFYNAAALDIFDTNQSLTGSSIANVLQVHNEHNAKVKIWDEIKANQRILTRSDLVLKQGDDKLSIELTATPIINDAELGSFGFVLMIRNITAEKTLEESKDEFIAVTGHELRTPIAVAEGSVSNLKAIINKGNFDEAVLKRSVEMADNQIKMLAKIANDLLTLSRLDRGIKAPKENIDIQKFADETIAKYQTSAREKGLTLRAEVEKNIGSIETTKLYLAEVLQNFVTNSIKYTQKGEVVLKIWAGEGFVEFDVVDTGIGISKKDGQKVFEKFYRSEDYRTRETGGTGLGLYIVQRLVAVIHGKIVFESELNKGSKFGIQIRRRDF
ncbi:MAG: cell wall metabolism sensor histidine kinase WalK [Candidatus Nomurabacteria bacterium]|jgi:PAS domain S-box-containing protein|nr:cell wall metabolism sensor histidine kinase WalK [Candidatus Nomurabacteria bacterium]